MDGTAIVYTHGLFDTNAAKTSHGLVRGSSRYNIVGIIDENHVGKDAGVVLEGKSAGIPFFASIQSYLDKTGQTPDYCIIGIANAGGKMNPDWYPDLKTALKAGISLVSGMHEFMSEIPELVSLAEQHGAQLIDVRKPKDRDDLHFWSARIDEVPSLKVAVMGTDCAVGKRTTAKFLVEACEAAGIKAQMIYTGQTGWLQGGQYGFVLDSTFNDFVSGELEHAMYQCYQETKPDVMFIEGQAALRNPSGPCGSEFLVSGMADAVILVTPAGRVYYKGWDHTGRKIPPLSTEVELIKLYGVPTIGIAINTKLVDHAEAKRLQAAYEDDLGIPVALPVEEGVEPLITALQTQLKQR
ncbi:MAG: DUF1611 domain-containing protein [Bacteroidota bacterium]